MFKRSPNLAKLGIVTVVKSADLNGNDNNSNGKESEMNDTRNEKGTHNISDGATLLLNEIVTEAASAANNKSRLQRDFDHSKI